MISIRRFGWTALALAALAGCDAGTSTTVETKNPAPAATPATPDVPKDQNDIKSLPVEPAPEPKKEAAADADKLSDEEIVEIKKLPPADQALALAQMTCPVSGGHLGESGMGAPIKQTIGDKTFFICCSGCEKDVKNKPAEVLAKLKK